MVKSINEVANLNPIETTGNEKIYYALSISVRGVKKRCRKSDLHHFHVGAVSLDFDRKELESKVYDLIFLNMKSISSMIYVTLNYTVEKKERDITCRQFEPFSDKNIKFQLFPLSNIL